MIFGAKQPPKPWPGRPSRAVITQNRLNEKNEPGIVKVPGVVSLDVSDGMLMGRNADRLVTMVIPVSEVALAVIEGDINAG
jgi:hypothetical protein